MTAEGEAAIACGVADGPCVQQTALRVVNNVQTALCVINYAHIVNQLYVTPYAGILPAAWGKEAGLEHL